MTRILKTIALALVGVVMSFALCRAQGTWQAGSLTFSAMTHGSMKYQYLLLNYSGTGTRSPVLVYEHQNAAGNACYTSGGANCTVLANSIANGGAGPQDWYNNSGFQSAYCSSGCIIVMPYADQTSDTTGATSNFGGFNDTPGSSNNEQAVAALIHFFLSNFNADPNRVYVTGDGTGGIGAYAMALDYGIKTGTIEQLVTAVIPMSGAISRAGGTLTNAQSAQIQGGPLIYAINGANDATATKPSAWSSPVWTKITGNSTFPGGPVGGVAGSSPFRYLLDTGLGFDTWDTYRPLPAGKPMLDALFFADSGNPGSGTLTGQSASALPSGYLHTVGAQILDGTNNNVRLACSGYDKPTGNAASDFTKMRQQGFNCARVPWFDKVTCPGGTCNFTTFDVMVNAATAQGMKIIFNHQANEGVNGTNSCTVRQANGLWYDLNGASPWTSTDGTDGCGTTGTVSYATFKSNWQSFATHYNGNSTVIGFDLHNEPTTFGNPACCTGGSTTPSGIFHVQNGKIIDPFGNQWRGRGINIGQEHVGIATAAELHRLFGNGLNFIRVAVGEGLDPSYFTAFAADMQANHIVAEIEDHSCFGGQANGNICTPFTGQQLANQNAFYSALAAAYKNNPYIWLGSLNEPNSSDGSYCTTCIQAIYTQQQSNYNTIRGQGFNNPIILENGLGGGNVGTIGAGATSNPGFSNSMTNIIWDIHVYNCQGGPNGTNDQNACNAAMAGSINDPGSGGGGGHGIAAAQTMQSADGIVPVMAGEYGESINGVNVDGDATVAINAVHNSGNLANGFAITSAWQWFPCPPSQCADVLTTDGNGGAPHHLSSYGQQIAAFTSAGPAFSGSTQTGPLPGVVWGGGTGTDLRAMVQDVGSAVLSINPNVLILTEGVLNNGTLFNGATRGSATFPATSGIFSDLSTVHSQALTCCAGQLIFSPHDFPTSISSAVPDSGTSMSTIRNTAWGYLATGNFNPVFISAMGASLDGTNGSTNLTDEQGWATGITQYMNGQLGGQGGPTFTGCKEPLGGAWYTFGNQAGSQPDGTLNADGTNKSGQFSFWNSLLYTACSVSGGGASVVTTWNPGDLSAGITLSGGNLVATSTTNAPASVRTTTSATSGQLCGEAVMNTVTSDWDFGLANSSYVLTSGNGLGGDANGIGFDPNSTGGNQGVFFNNAALSTGASPSANGEAATVCVDLTAKLFWVTTQTMRAAGNPWNNSAAANPATATGGISFAGMTCPCFLIYNNFQTGGVATLNATGPFTVSLPAGFSAFQAGGSTGTGGGTGGGGGGPPPTGLQSASVGDFLNTIGINGQVQSNITVYVSNPTNTKNDAVYMGARLWRDGLQTGSNQLAVFSALANAGLKFTFVPWTTTGSPYTVDPPTLVSLANTIQGSTSNGIKWLEGPNEPNNFPIVYNGNTGGGTGTYAPIAQFQSAYYSAIKASSGLNGTLVGSISQTESMTDNVGLQFPTVPAGGGGTTAAGGTVFFDTYNIHLYPEYDGTISYVSPAGDQFNAQLTKDFVNTNTGHFAGNSLNTVLGSGQLIMSEFGIRNSVDANVRGKNIMMAYLDAYMKGFTGAFCYELYDEGDGYGLFSGTNSPSTAATYMHNLTTILSDSRTALPPSKLNVTVSNLPTNGLSKLFQKSDGSFWMVIWRNETNYNLGAGTVVTVSPVNVGLGLAGVGQFIVYDPTVGTAAQSTTNAASINVAVRDYPMIVRIVPPISTPTPAPKPIILIFGENDNHPKYANDDEPFSNMMDLTVR